MGRENRSINRRKLLSTVAPAALALSGVAAAAPVTVNPDAQLLGLCAEHEALYHKADAALAKNDDEQERADAITNAIYDEQSIIVVAITACRPTTPAGFVALAQVATMANPMLIDAPWPLDDDGGKVLRVLLCGILGRNAA